MSAQRLHDFFAMGGYAGYVWPAYAVFFGVLLIDTVSPRLRRRRLLRGLRTRLARQGARLARSHETATYPAAMTRDAMP